MVSYAISVGQSEEASSFLPISGAAGGLVGHIVFAILMKFKPESSPEIFAVSTVTSCISLFFYVHNSSFLQLMIVSFFAGFGIYDSTSAYYTMAAMTVSRQNFSGIMAIAFVIAGIGSISAGSLAGIDLSYFP